MSVIWFDIDFNIHRRFADLPPNTIAKHGHRIRLVRNALGSHQVTVFNNPSVNGLRNLQLSVTAQIASGKEIVSRSITSLQTLCLIANSTNEQRDSLIWQVFTSILTPLSANPPPKSPSSLRLLIILNMNLSHDDLVTILQASPSLKELRLFGTDVIGRRSTELFQHTGVTHFSFWSSNNVESDHDSTAHSTSSSSSSSSSSPSIFAYFPSLECLQVDSCRSNTTFTFEEIKNQVLQHCPNLTGFRLRHGGSGDIVTRYCRDIGRAISELTFRYDHLSTDSIAAILLHRATLRRVAAIDIYTNMNFEADEVAQLVRPSGAYNGSAQFIPRSCPRLEELNLYVHEMDMDEVEKEEWVCKELKSVRLRIKGLCTKEDIVRTIALWRRGCWRRWQEKAGNHVAIEDEDEADFSIEARVARHLLKFEKLWSVWLGYQTWTPV